LSVHYFEITNAYSLAASKVVPIGRSYVMPLATENPQSAAQKDESRERLRDFLLQQLPPAMTTEASYLVNAVFLAGARYDRIAARRHEWLDYAVRKKRLESITKSANLLAGDLYHLDIVSYNQLATRFEPKQIEALLGFLVLVAKETQVLAENAQATGRPRDLAEEQWIVEMAEIYENAFSQPARVSGSGGDPSKRRGKFFRFLELSRPATFPRFGKLAVRQIERVLKRRKRK